MANVANFEVNGVSYSYDTESRNPLSDKVKVKAFEGGLVYDINTKEPTEVVGVPANNLKVAGKASEASVESVDPVEPSEPVDERQERTLTFYAEWNCIDFPVTIVYKGSLYNTDGKPRVYGMIDGESQYGESFHNELFDTQIFEVDGYKHYGPYGDDGAVLRDNSEDEGFEIVRVDQAPYNYPSTTLTIKVTDVRF